MPSQVGALVPQRRPGFGRGGAANRSECSITGSSGVRPPPVPAVAPAPACGTGAACGGGALIRWRRYQVACGTPAAVHAALVPIRGASKAIASSVTSSARARYPRPSEIVSKSACSSAWTHPPRSGPWPAPAPTGPSPRAAARSAHPADQPPGGREVLAGPPAHRNPGPAATRSHDWSTAPPGAAPRPSHRSPPRHTRPPRPACTAR